MRGVYQAELQIQKPFIAKNAKAQRKTNENLGALCIFAVVICGLILVNSFHNIDFGGAIGREDSGDVGNNNGNKESHNHARNW